MIIQIASPSIIYSRVDQFDDELDLTQQEAWCRAYAQEMGSDVLKVFIDEAPGSSYSRPGLTRLLDYARASGHELNLLVSDVSRLARNPSILFVLQRELRASGVTLIETACVPLRSGSTVPSLASLLWPAVAR